MNDWLNEWMNECFGLMNFNFDVNLIFDLIWKRVFQIVNFSDKFNYLQFFFTWKPILKLSLESMKLSHEFAGKQKDLTSWDGQRCNIGLYLPWDTCQCALSKICCPVYKYALQAHIVHASQIDSHVFHVENVQEVIVSIEINCAVFDIGADGSEVFVQEGFRTSGFFQSRPSDLEVGNPLVVADGEEICPIHIVWVDCGRFWKQSCTFS